MQSVPLAALDLPLKVLVWDGGGQTEVGYTAPAGFAARYQLRDGLAEGLDAIGPTTEALVVV